MTVRTLDTWRARAACRGPETALFFPPNVAERKDERERLHVREQVERVVRPGAIGSEADLTYAAVNSQVTHAYRLTTNIGDMEYLVGALSPLCWPPLFIPLQLTAVRSVIIVIKRLSKMQLRD